MIFFHRQSRRSFIVMFQTRQSRRRRGRRQRRQRRAATAQRRRSVIHFLYLFACDVCLTPASLSLSVPLSLFSSPGESFTKRACAFVDKTEKIFGFLLSASDARARKKHLSLWTKKKRLWPFFQWPRGATVDTRSIEASFFAERDSLCGEKRQ